MVSSVFWPESWWWWWWHGYLYDMMMVNEWWLWWWWWPPVVFFAYRIVFLHDFWAYYKSIQLFLVLFFFKLSIEVAFSLMIIISSVLGSCIQDDDDGLWCDLGFWILFFFCFAKQFIFRKWISRFLVTPYILLIKSNHFSFSEIFIHQKFACCCIYRMMVVGARNHLIKLNLDLLIF